jgi:hypothetical protein
VEVAPSPELLRNSNSPRRGEVIGVCRNPIRPKRITQRQAGGKTGDRVNKLFKGE